jgi:hypothetical protein
MSTLQKPKFKKLSYSSFGGAPLLLSLWNRFDFSLLLTESGIFKTRGVPTWKLAFLFVVGLISRCTSCLQMVEFYSQESLLKRMFDGKAITQSVFSRFMTSKFQWNVFNLKRIAKFQENKETRLEDGDVIALDDTLVEHNYAKKIPFIYRLWDHCSHTYVDAMNLVVLHGIKASGLQYPLLYSIWRQDNGKDPHQTKLNLALTLLQQLKSQLTDSVKLWVAMDSWFFVKDFYLDIEELGFDWVTKAKKNTTLYRKITIRGKERFIPILPEALFKEAKPVFSFWKKKGPLCMEFKDIYLPIDEIRKGRGYRKEPILKPIKAVVTAYLDEDQESGESKETFALLLSNQTDAKPVEIVKVYKKRWAIEVFFRNAKQELGLNHCHSTDENHIHAHLSLLFVAESLVRFAQWQYNEKTSEKEEVTHGQVVALLFHTRCEVRAKNTNTIQVYFDMTSRRFASFFEEHWPIYLKMGWFDMQKNRDYYPPTG